MIISLSSSPIWHKPQLVAGFSLSWPSSSGGCVPPLHLGSYFAYGQQSTLHFLQKVNCFESSTINIAVSHEVIWTNSEYCIVLNGNHVLQICGQTCVYFIYSTSLPI